VSSILHTAVVAARDTFLELETGLRLLRKDIAAQACNIAKEGMNKALREGEEERVSLDMLGDSPVSALDEIEKVMGDVYALLQTVSLDEETRAAVDELGCVHLKYFASQSEKFGSTDEPEEGEG
jgi:hypothetical protein